LKKLRGSPASSEFCYVAFFGVKKWILNKNSTPTGKVTNILSSLFSYKMTERSEAKSASLRAFHFAKLSHFIGE
jgi:hypothetical protein